MRYSLIEKGGIHPPGAWAEGVAPTLEILARPVVEPKFTRNFPEAVVREGASTGRVVFTATCSHATVSKRSKKQTNSCSRRSQPELPLGPPADDKGNSEDESGAVNGRLFGYLDSLLHLTERVLASFVAVLLVAFFSTSNLLALRMLSFASWLGARVRVRACSIRFSFTRSRLCLVYIAQKELWSELDWLLVLAPAKRTMTLELVPHEIENHKLDLNVGVVGTIKRKR